MPGKKATGSVRHVALHIDATAIPLAIHREKRLDMRVALGSRSFLLRIPASFNLRQEQEALAWAERWIEELLANKPALLGKFSRRSYADGDKLRLGETVYEVHVQKTGTDTLRGRVTGNKMTLYLPDEPTPEAVSRLVSRLAAKTQLPYLSRKVAFWNNRSFQETVKGVRLRYNRSRWGSCSSSRTLNFSTRLL